MKSVDNTVSPKNRDPKRAKNLSSRIKNHSSDQTVDFDKLLFQISIKFSALIIDDFDKEIQDALRQVVEYLDLDRGTLFEFDDIENKLEVIVFYAQPGIPAPYAVILPKYSRGIKKGKVMLFSSSDEMSDTFAVERSHVKATKLKSNIGLPLKLGGRVIGALLLDMYREERKWPGALIEKLRLLAEVFCNVLARKRAYDSQQNILKLEELISSISTKFLHIPPERIDDEIENSLRDIVMHLGIDRSTLFQAEGENSEGSLKFKITHAWARINAGSTMWKLSEANWPWAFKKILQDNFFSFSHIDELPLEASVDRQSMIVTNTKSSMAVPLIISDRIEGLIAFGSTQRERTWSPEIISRAKMIAQVFTNILARKKADIQLRNAYSEIKQLKERAESENIYLKGEIELHHHNNLVGHSKAVKKIVEQCEKVSQTNSTVLILGETGTGKDLIAHEIHQMSSRKDRPLVKLDCSALPASLVESELFGREKGAFTGAVSTKPGRFEIADRSTIFLNEIGEMPLELQTKLLRVIEEGEFERLGSTKTIKIDTRVIAATSRNLSEDVKEGKFRQDLYYRLKIFPIWIAPLRDRPEDIPELTAKFVDEFSKSMGKKIDKIPRKVMEMLQSYLWPGNIRELRNVIEHAMILSDGNTLNVILPKNEEHEISINSTLVEVERQHILKVLDHTRWRIKGDMGAAKILQIHPSTLYSRMKKLGITRIE